MSACPKSNWPWVKTMLHSVYDQPDDYVAGPYTLEFQRDM